MWIGASAFGLIAQVLPGTPHEHMGWVFVLAFFAAAWGALSIVSGLTNRTMPLPVRAVVTGLMMPVVAVALWATGGATSYLQPLLVLTALFVSWFFPPRMAWPLVALFLAAFASPLLYDDRALDIGYLARSMIFAAAVCGQTLAMQVLKRRLVRAELRQRSFAELDSLTGVGNRRGFDQALELAATQGDGFALVLFDLDDFKPINDAWGHPTGDAVLRAVADAARGVVRDGDHLARIGGDEFAVVIESPRSELVIRLVERLDEAIDRAVLPEQVELVAVSFAWALAPADGEDPQTVFACADQRLLAAKRERKLRRDLSREFTNHPA
jgi:diguanylate cyclase (GGDEF)-like protein